MSSDLALDLETHDLIINNGDLSVVNDADQLEQNLTIRLQFFLGEWFLNVNKGMPFYSNILVKNPNVANVDSLIKATILDTEGVTEILEYISSYNNVTREYTVKFKIRTIYGISELSQSLFSSKIG